jgi:hypothetical protein
MRKHAGGLLTYNGAGLCSAWTAIGRRNGKALSQLEILALVNFEHKWLIIDIINPYRVTSTNSMPLKIRRFDSGGYAAIGRVDPRTPGYLFRNVTSQSPFNTRVGICSRRCALREVHCICRCLQ